MRPPAASAASLLTLVSKKACLDGAAGVDTTDVEPPTQMEPGLGASGLESPHVSSKHPAREGSSLNTRSFAPSASGVEGKGAGEVAKEICRNTCTSCGVARVQGEACACVDCDLDSS
jgi:hypothetical protein